MTEDPAPRYSRIVDQQADAARSDPPRIQNAIWPNYERTGLTPAFDVAWPDRCAHAISRLTQKLHRTALSYGVDSLAHWASLYLQDLAPRCSPNTLEAKARDLDTFACWFARVCHETRLRAWRAGDTQAFVATLRGLRRAPTTINRALATLKHFARWAQDKHGAFVTGELPTRDIPNITEDELPCKKLSIEEVTTRIGAFRQRVLDVDAQRVNGQSDGRRLARLRPRRDLALFTTLVFTGLRVQELIVLRLSQLRNGCLWRVARKGNHETPRVYVHPTALAAIEDYVRNEREEHVVGEGAPLFVSTRTASFMSREQVARAAGISPHILRHTFGAWYREASGSDVETAAALAHRSLAHVGRYVRKSDEERDALVRKAFARCI